MTRNPKISAEQRVFDDELLHNDVYLKRLKDDDVTLSFILFILGN